MMSRKGLTGVDIRFWSGCIKKIRFSISQIFELFFLPELELMTIPSKFFKMP